MKNLALEHLALELYGQPWAILPDKLTAIVNAFERRRAGVAVDEDELKAIHAERQKSAVVRGRVIDLACGLSALCVGPVAILPMHGVVVQRPGIFTRYSGGMSCEQFVLGHAELLADDSVKSVVWDVHSPGGSVYGVEESFRRLFAMRGKKPTTAYSNTVMCSAAYYLACAADEIDASPSSITGNIGVVMTREDWTKKNEMAGVKVHYISAGKYKTEGWPDQPLNDEARAAAQVEVDSYYDQFVQAVADARGVKPDAVRNGMGEGRALTSKFALSAGLVDNVATIETILARRGADSPHPRTAKAAFLETRIRLENAQRS